jgi:hypothetical protein
MLRTSVAPSIRHDCGSGAFTMRVSAPMMIRIIKRPPAPLMDGFDVSRFEVGNMYEVDAQLGRYLVTAENAERIAESAQNLPRHRTKRSDSE